MGGSHGTAVIALPCLCHLLFLILMLLPGKCLPQMGLQLITKTNVSMYGNWLWYSVPSAIPFNSWQLLTFVGENPAVSFSDHQSIQISCPKYENFLIELYFLFWTSDELSALPEVEKVLWSCRSWKVEKGGRTL